ncbi:MAG: OmpA family protein [Gammaproteobacteria bacterium]
MQIGPTPAGGKIACYQLAQPNLRHHVEPLRLDEFGYLFPPLRPEAKLASAGAPAAVTKVAPLHAAPAIPVAVVPTPTPTVAASTAKIAPTPAPTETLPATTAMRYITKTVHFSTRLPFKLNRAHLAHQNRVALLAFVNSLEQYRGVESIRITGHTDRSGPARFNNWLSGMRAKSVQLWLLSLGVDPRITHVRGVGSSEPRAHARSAADNRYVDIKVMVRIPAR